MLPRDRCHQHPDSEKMPACTPGTEPGGSASVLQTQPKLERAAHDRACSSPSTGPMSSSSGTRETLTTSPSCPSPRTASGSPTFSSTSCEYCHQTLGGRAGVHGHCCALGTSPQDSQSGRESWLGPQLPIVFLLKNFSFSMPDVETLHFLVQGSLLGEKEPVNEVIPCNSRVRDSCIFKRAVVLLSRVKRG